MKQKAQTDNSGLTRLAALNPVPASDREILIARLGQIRPQLPHVEPSRPRRWKPPIVTLAVMFVLAIGGVAVASSWNPLAAIGSADRPAEPTDTLSPAVIQQLRVNEEGPPGWVSPIGNRLVDQARLLGELPDGHRVYAVPTSKGKLCIVVAERAESCSDPLTRERPITLTIAKAGPSTPHVIWGVTADDVVSVSFTVGRLPVTVPVVNNFFAWEGQTSARFAGVSPAIVTFSDGTTAVAR